MFVPVQQQCWCQK